MHQLTKMLTFAVQLCTHAPNFNAIEISAAEL